MLALLAMITASVQAAPPGSVRPDTHIFQVPWWEREPTPLPPPEATAAPESQPYSLAEFSPIERVILTTWYNRSSWGYPAVTPSYTGMVKALQDRDIPVTICDSPEPESAARAALSAAGVDVEAVDWMSCSLNTIWMRDFGPFFTIAEDTTTLIGDAVYAGRPLDNAFPERYATDMGHAAHRVGLTMEGGNFYSNGEGLCVTTNTIYAWYSVTESRARETFQDTLGCDETLFLEPLIDEGTGHVDMFFTFTDRDAAIMGSYDPSYDRANAELLDRNAAALEAAGLVVHRVPMLPHEDMNGDGWDDFHTVINGFFANTDTGQRFLMPTYYESYPTQTAEALAAMEAAMPGVEIVEIPSDDLITYGGSLHCVVKTVPTERWPNPCDDVYAFNDDDPRCDEPDPDTGTAPDTGGPADTGSSTGNETDTGTDGETDAGAGDGPNFQDVDDTAESADAKAGCACTTASPSHSGWLALIPLAWARRRERDA